ncbi:MAG: FHA domain-containing protein [Comamonadaceae bacterium]|nr:FHA domain-containing protein [Comamonadaceae bacterium]
MAHDNLLVGAAHFLILCQSNGRYVISDNLSTKGTFVNDEQIDRAAPSPPTTRSSRPAPRCSCSRRSCARRRPAPQPSRRASRRPAPPPDAKATGAKTRVIRGPHRDPTVDPAAGTGARAGAGAGGLRDAAADLQPGVRRHRRRGRAGPLQADGQVRPGLRRPGRRRCRPRRGRLLQLRRRLRAAPRVRWPATSTIWMRAWPTCADSTRTARNSTGNCRPASNRRRSASRR